VDHGQLTKVDPNATVTANPNPVCVGSTITFTAPAVVDTGGLKWVNCADVQLSGGVEYHWNLTLPGGYPAPLPPTSGQGASVSVNALVAGSYTAGFTATPTRTDCAPGTISLGSITASAHGCALLVSSATGKPCETVNLTLTASCPSDCGQMAIQLAPQYAPPYDTLVPPWLDMPPMAPIPCDGNAHDSTISVVIHGDAPPGDVPIEVTGTVSNGSSCMATGTITVDRTYPEIEILYKTFIAPSAVETPPDPLLMDFFAGDNRWFGYGASPSRTLQSALVTLDPAKPTGQAGASIGQFGTTHGYDDDPDGSDVVACPHCAGDYGDWCLLPGATADCVLTAVAGQNGNVLSVTHTRISSTEVEVRFDLVGGNPCAAGIIGPDAPPINATLTVRFREVCANATLQPAEFRLYGTHDGFPWHEVYINGSAVYEHDPCCTGEGPSSLFGGEGEHYFEATDLCHQQDPPLNQWRRVPVLP